LLYVSRRSMLQLVIDTDPSGPSASDTINIQHPHVSSAGGRVPLSAFVGSELVTIQVRDHIISSNGSSSSSSIHAPPLLSVYSGQCSTAHCTCSSITVGQLRHEYSHIPPWVWAVQARSRLCCHFICSTSGTASYSGNPLDSDVSNTSDDEEI
jgi:hypothetical protein